MKASQEPRYMKYLVYERRAFPFSSRCGNLKSRIVSRREQPNRPDAKNKIKLKYLYFPLCISDPDQYETLN